MIELIFTIDLKKYRKLKKLSQKELSKLSGLSQSYISDLEKDLRVKAPTLTTIVLLANALEICPYCLLTLTCNLKDCKKSIKKHYR